LRRAGPAVRSARDAPGGMVVSAEPEGDDRWWHWWPWR